MGFLKKLMTDKNYSNSNYIDCDERKNLREEKEQNMNIYIDFINSIEHKNNIPIKIAINKYREQLNCPLNKGDIGNSDKWILQSIMRLHKILLIDKVKNRWVCSKERLDNFDFTKFNISELGNTLRED